MQVVLDTGGSPTQVADDASSQRMKDHGVTITVTTQIMAELASLWSEGAGPAIQKVLEEEILSVTMNDQPLAAAAK